MLTDTSLPRDVIRLADLAGAVLDQGPPTNRTIDKDLATLAARRHGLGPLLHAAVRSGLCAAEPDAVALLEKSYQDNVLRQAVIAKLLLWIGSFFDKAGIRWLVFKGLPQARQLYNDPAWRVSSDIDILVSSQDFGAAIDILGDAGFRPSDGTLPPRRVLRQMALRTLRDIVLVHRGMPAYRIELHQRPLFARGGKADLVRLEPAQDGGAIPAPAIGANLAYYLIAHGALSYWARLKWLMDLIPLFAKLSDADKHEIIALGAATRSSVSLAASLSLLRALHPSIALGVAGAWLDDMGDNKGVRRRLTTYATALSANPISKATPLDNRWLALKSNLMFFDAPSMRARLLIAGPQASLLRILMKQVG